MSISDVRFALFNIKGDIPPIFRLRGFLMDDKTIRISFPDVSADIANGLAESLAAELRREVDDEGKGIEPEVVRTDNTAQDFGTTIVLVLGTPAVLICAKAILAWARRTDRAEIELNGVRIRNLNSTDVADIVRALNP